MERLSTTSLSFLHDKIKLKGFMRLLKFWIHTPIHYVSQKRSLKTFNFLGEVSSPNSSKKFVMKSFLLWKHIMRHRFREKHPRILPFPIHNPKSQ